MDVVSFTVYHQRIKIFLIFFCFSGFLQCKKKDSNLSFEVLYENSRAVALDFNSDVIKDSVRVHLKHTKIAILGDFIVNPENLRFVPVLPFAENEVYTINYLGNAYDFTTKKISKEGTTPKLLHMYPSSDTIPENLLKMYFVFSKPMQEVGSVLDFITVRNLDTNTNDDVFLALETELWNKKHTELTLWLDPGRVKTNLIPNKEKGLPIKKGTSYLVTLDKNYKDAYGNLLEDSFSKYFYVTKRDVEKPNIELWTVKIPKSRSQEALIIYFKEPLDALLLTETITVFNKDNERIQGNFVLGTHEKSIFFYPSRKWKKGSYKIQIDAKLEDLAANNFNTLFDHDLMSTNDTVNHKEFYFLSFNIY